MTKLNSTDTHAKNPQPNTIKATKLFSKNNQDRQLIILEMMKATLERNISKVSILKMKLPSHCHVHVEAIIEGMAA